MWPFRSRRWRLPNEVVLALDEKQHLRSLCDAVEKTDEFEHISQFSWTLSNAKVQTPAQIEHSDLVPNAEKLWTRDVRKAISNSSAVGIIEFQTLDRTGLEHLPAHVRGKSYTFFLDANTRDVLYCLKGVYSV
jgi:hypothetical protein